MAILSHTNGIDTSTVTVTTGTAENLDELKAMQVPLPFATLTPDAGVVELRAVFTTTPIRVVGLVGHDIPDTATIEFRDSTDTLITSLAVNRPNAFAVIDELSAGEIRYKITGLSAAPIRIALLWADAGFEAVAEASGEHGGTDYGYRSKVGAVTWTNPRTVARTVPATFRGLTEDQAFGDLEDLFTAVGTTRPVVYIPVLSTQAQINRRAVYGTLGARGRIIPEKPLYRAEFDVDEMV